MLAYPLLVKTLTSSTNPSIESDNSFSGVNQRTPQDIITQAVTVEEKLGMDEDQIYDSLLPIADALTSGKMEWEVVHSSLSDLSSQILIGDDPVVQVEGLSAYTALTIAVSKQLGVEEPRARLEELKTCEEMLRRTAYGLRDVDQIEAARAMISWRDSKPFEGFMPEEVPSQELGNLKDLLFLIPAADFDDLGKLISQGVFQTSPKKTIRVEQEDEGDWEEGEEDEEELHEAEQVEKLFEALPPADIRARIIDCFVTTGYASKSKTGSIRLTKRGKDEISLGYDSLRNSVMSFDFMTLPERSEPIASLGEVAALYERATEANQVETVVIETEKPSRRILYLSEILLGSSTSDIVFLESVLDRIEASPPEIKPDIVVASGLLNGGFKYRRKDQRQNLIMDLNQQFSAAKLILDRLAKLGIHVIYNMSDGDREICRDATIDAMKMMGGLSKPISDQATYYEQERLQQNPVWDRHRAFLTNVGFEYCLRSGRSLLTAEEVAVATGGKVRMHEYLMLFDAYDKLTRGEEIPPEYSSVLNLDNIPLPEREFTDFQFYDDFDLITKIQRQDGSVMDVTDMIRHSSLKFGIAPKYRNPSDATEAALRHLESEGKAQPPTTLVLLHQEQALSKGTASGNGILLTPGFTDPSISLEQKGSVEGSGFPVGHRLLTTRRALPFPSAIMQEMTEDQRSRLYILNRKLLEKAQISADRVTAAFVLDWQQGSVTARADLQIKLLDIILQSMEDGPVRLFLAGDIIQGRNYPDMPNENAPIGLIRIGDQQEYVRRMLMLSLQDVSPDVLKSLQKVDIVPGNHETNSGYAWTGSTHSSFLQPIFEKSFEGKGLNIPIVYHDTVATRFGDYFRSWTAFDENVGGYGLLVQHLIMENGAKGQKDTPIYQAEQVFRGEGELVQHVDIATFGHWHHPEFALFGNKAAVISPAVAGLSGYEWMRSYRPVIGAVLLHMGGGLPLMIEFLSARSLYGHEITQGYFSQQHLQQLGFQDDFGFDPASHGLFVPRQPKSALQKFLLAMRDEVIATPQTMI